MRDFGAIVLFNASRTREALLRGSYQQERYILVVLGLVGLAGAHLLVLGRNSSQVGRVLLVAGLQYAIWPLFIHWLARLIGGAGGASRSYNLYAFAVLLSPIPLVCQTIPIIGPFAPVSYEVFLYAVTGFGIARGYGLRPWQGLTVVLTWPLIRVISRIVLEINIPQVGNGV